MKLDSKMSLRSGGAQARSRRGRRWVWLALPLATALLLAPGPASADEEEGGLPDLSSVLSGASLGAGVASLLPARLVGHVTPAGHASGGPSNGVFLGVDTGVSLALASGFDPAQHAWTVGVRGGYEFHNGVALQARYDYLGLAPHLTDPPASPMQLATFGMRYTLPFLIPLPFVEAMWGPSFSAGGSVSVVGGIGLGGSVPIGRHLRIDLAVRDWITPIDYQVHQILTFELGAAVSLGSLGHS